MACDVPNPNHAWTRESVPKLAVVSDRTTESVSAAVESRIERVAPMERQLGLWPRLKHTVRNRTATLR